MHTCLLENILEGNINLKYSLTTVKWLYKAMDNTRDNFFYQT